MGKGKPGGALADLHPVDLLSQLFQELMARTGIDPGRVDDILVGCVSQAGEQSSTPGRQAWLAAGFPAHVPAATIERKCGSSQQAVEFAAHGILAGAYEMVIAAGVESMSRVPMGSARMGQDPFGPGVTARYPNLIPQGVSAELVAGRWGLSRAELDEYAARSHERAAAAAAKAFADEIASVQVPGGAVVSEDETIRPDTTPERLARLAPAFASDRYRELFPDIDWKVTAGNSSQITDGASALLLMSGDLARSLGLRRRARVLAGVAVGDDPVLMLTGPIPATRKLLQRTGVCLADVGAIEINEAFACVPLAWQREFGVDESRLNPRGGAIALGHPLGASGCRLMTTLINQLEERGGGLGLQTMCEAGGMANATLIEVAG
jgi:acetyl-CoA acetyltransferase family protein